MQRKKPWSNGLVFEVCEAFTKGKGASEIADDLGRRGVKITREEVYRILAEGRRRGFIRLCPPRAEYLATRIADIYGKPRDDVQVLDVGTKAAADQVAAAGADWALEIIRKVGRKKKKVHVGLGAGWTTMVAARHLALAIRRGGGVPDLTLHALNSGFSVDHPETSPVAFFNLFHDVGPKIDYVGFFAPPVFKCGDYHTVRNGPGVSRSFEAGGEIDVVITSLAGSDDPHGQLTEFMSFASAKGQKALQTQGWLGDVQYRPYSSTQPITVDTDIRAVTLFELSDLVKLAAAPDKYVILIAGPCRLCGKTKSDAIRPLLQQPSLKVWNRIVMDADTALELCPPEQERAVAAR